MQRAIYSAMNNVNIEDYQSQRIVQDACYNAVAKPALTLADRLLRRANPAVRASAAPAVDCTTTRLAGFVRAAEAIKDQKVCWRALRTLPNFDDVRTGFTMAFKKYDPPNAICTEPVKPVSCVTGYCPAAWGNGDFGLAFRPAVELGATLGKGLGFSDTNGGLSAQFNGTLGIRFFMFQDKIDLHAAVGVAATTAPQSSQTGSDSRGFLVTCVGMGFLSGLFGATYIHTFDPFISGRGQGNGLGIAADLVAVERLVDKYQNP